MNGKGSTPRPVDIDKYQENYEKIYGKKMTKAEVDAMTGVIKLETQASNVRQERKVKIIKEYIDENGIEMIIININNSFTNKTIPKQVYLTMERELVNKDTIDTNHEGDK